MLFLWCVAPLFHDSFSSSCDLIYAFRYVEFVLARRRRPRPGVIGPGRRAWSDAGYGTPGVQQRVDLQFGAQSRAGTSDFEARRGGGKNHPPEGTGGWMRCGVAVRRLNPFFGR